MNQGTAKEIKKPQNRERIKNSDKDFNKQNLKDSNWKRNARTKKERRKGKRLEKREKEKGKRRLSLMVGNGDCDLRAKCEAKEG